MAEPQLRRVLTRSALILYGLAVITPTAPYAVFGIVQAESGGHTVLSYLVAMLAMVFTATSYGRMAAVYPAAGSTYTYARRTFHSHVGFLAGWAMILDYVLVPMLSAIIVGLTAVRFVPQAPYSFWLFAFAALITAVNIRGIEMTARANRIMVAIMSFSVILFIGMAALYVTRRGGVSGLFTMEPVFNDQTFGLRKLMLGAGIATLSYLGFDAVSTLAEDTRHPERDIGFATVAVCVLQTGICLAVVYLAAIVWPFSKPFPNVETAILDISRVAGGELLFGVTTFVFVVAAVASSVTCQAGASRLLYGMGRDGMLPRSFFGRLNARYSTPDRNILLIAALSFAGALFAGLQLVVELVNFGALTGFILVNLAVIKHYFIDRRQRAVWLNLVLPGLGAVACAYVWVNLSSNAKVAGFCWLGAGLLYLAALTRGFRVDARELELP